MIFNLPTFFLFIGAQACAIVFSTVDRDSFEAVEKWRTKVKFVYSIICVFCIQQCTAVTCCIPIPRAIQTFCPVAVKVVC